MNILFISSGNTKSGLPIINVRNQAKSLKEKNVNVLQYSIKGKGLMGYLKNALPLALQIKKNNIDVIHAHYALSAYLATISVVIFSIAMLSFFKKKVPIVVSLMGSDIQLRSFKKQLLIFCINYLWDETIVKSDYMYKKLKVRSLKIITNGVDLKSIKEKQSFDNNSKFVLFGSDPSRYSKNFNLTQKAFDIAKKKRDIELKIVYGVNHDEIIEEINNARVFLLTSRYEGASIIIKEAMACNCPIVATDVGDINWVTKGTEGCYVVKNYDPKEIADMIIDAFDFSETKGKTQGRFQIKKLGLDSESIADKIISIYSSVLNV